MYIFGTKDGTSVVNEASCVAKCFCLLQVFLRLFKTAVLKQPVDAKTVIFQILIHVQYSVPTAIVFLKNKKNTLSEF